MQATASCNPGPGVIAAVDCGGCSLLPKHKLGLCLNSHSCTLKQMRARVFFLVQISELSIGTTSPPTVDHTPALQHQRREGNAKHAFCDWSCVVLFLPFPPRTSICLFLLQAVQVFSADLGQDQMHCSCSI